MSADRRIVRATRRFFEDLDRRLPTDRGAEGQPSRSDFQAIELFRIVEIFATGFDDLPAFVADRPDYRVLYGTGLLVASFTVIGQLVADGSIQLLSLELDLDLGWE